MRSTAGDAADQPVRCWTPFEQCWLTEAVRLHEEAAHPLDDRQAVAEAQAGGGGLDQRLLQRGLVLADCSGLGKVLQVWQVHARLALLVLAGLAVVAGYGVGAALAASGEGTRAVNVVWALGGLLGLPSCTLLLWLGLLLVGQRDAVGMPGRGWLRLANRLTAAPQSVYLGQALAGLLGRAQLMSWLLGLVTHGWWLLALLGALAGLLTVLSLHRYDFFWESTLWSATVLHGLVQGLGWLPQQLFGFAVPDEAILRASEANASPAEAARVAWSSWLIGCLLVYGILPRLLLALLCLFCLWSGRRRLQLDLSLPGYVLLADRLMPASERVGVTDAAPAVLEQPHMAPPAVAAVADPANVALLVGLELPPDVAWPPPLPTGAHDFGRLDGREPRRRLLQQVRDNPPARLLMACAAAQSPDRGSLRLLAELSHHCSDCRVWLIGAATSRDGERLGYWHEALAATGLSQQQVFDDDRSALAWLGGQA